MCVIRVPANGVCTSHRFQNNEGLCRYGCEALDDLLHFWNCNILACAVDRCIQLLKWDRNVFIRITNRSLQFETLLFARQQVNIATDTKMALMVEAIVHCHNVLRNEGVQGIDGGQDGDCRITHLLHERILSYVQCSSYLARTINAGGL